MFCCIAYGIAGSAQVNQPMDLIQNEPRVIGVPLQQHKRLQLHPLLECSALQISLQPDYFVLPASQGCLGEDLNNDQISIRVSMDLKDMFTVFTRNPVAVPCTNMQLVYMVLSECLSEKMTSNPSAGARYFGVVRPLVHRSARSAEKKFTFIFQLSGWALVVSSCFALHCY